MKLRFVLLAFVCAAGIGILSFFLSTEPPREEAVIQDFYKHRSEFEQLRTMLQEDHTLTDVAEWGITTEESSLDSVPPEGSVPEARFQQYLKLLKAIHANRAGQSRGPQPGVYFGMWVSGFAGDTRHVNVCDLTYVPENQVTSLRAFYKTPKPRQPVFKHIEGNWYLWADW